MTATALLSPDKLFRYRLRREWAPAKGTALFVMLNPSTADHLTDDPTVRRCRAFAAREDFGAIEIVNLFAFRATDPAELKGTWQAKIGQANDRHIAAALAERPALVVAAWGAKPGEHPGWLERARDVFATLKAAAGPRGVRCLGITAEGFPCHPLYRPSGQAFVRLERHP